LSAVVVAPLLLVPVVVAVVALTGGNMTSGCGAKVEFDLIGLQTECICECYDF